MNKSLLDWCQTDAQKLYVEARLQYGSYAEAARQLGVDESTVRKTVYRVISYMENVNEESNNIVDESTNKLPKILVIDIETAPILAYVWNVWKQNVGHNQVQDHSYIMCFAAKWLDEEEVMYMETRNGDDTEIVKEMVKLLDEADFVIAHNAKRFDIPKIKTQAIIHGMQPPSPFKIIDTLLIARREFAFERNTLQHLADILKCSPKLSHAKFSGFDLWKECLVNNEEAWEEMMEYNIQDINTLEEVYKKLRGWDSRHPNIGVNIESDKPVCSKCGSNNLKHNGYTYTDVSKFELFKCQECGGFSRGRKSQNSKEVKDNLLTNAKLS